MAGSALRPEMPIGDQSEVALVGAKSAAVAATLVRNGASGYGRMGRRVAPFDSTVDGPSIGGRSIGAATPLAADRRRRRGARWRLSAGRNFLGSRSCWYFFFWPSFFTMSSFQDGHSMIMKFSRYITRLEIVGGLDLMASYEANNS